MPTVILLRHGRTTANAGGVLAGHAAGIALDDVGEAQARAVGERLSGVRLSGIVTSPLERTKQTARIVAGQRRRKIPIRMDRSFIECDYGDWTMKKLSTLAKKPLWSVVQTHPSSATFPNGESMAAMQHRAVAGIRRLNAELGDRAIYVVVSHGDVIKSIIADALGMHLDNFQRISVDPCSLSVISYTPHRPFVVKVNDTGEDLSYLTPRTKKQGSDAVVGGGSGGSRA